MRTSTEETIHDETCKQAHYVCRRCGVATYDGYDCGHVAQPTPVSPDEHGDPVCDDCYESAS